MIIFQAIYLAFPLILGGLLHACVLRWNLFSRLAIPLDFGRCSQRGRRIFGANKTLRGVVVMTAGAVTGIHLQAHLYALSIFRQLSLFDYSRVDALAGGVALGLGFTLAELPNSFLKRQFGIPPGGRGEGMLYWFFMVLDQADSVAGCLLAAALTFWVPDWNVVAAVLAVGIFIHMIVNACFVAMGIKERVL